MLKYKDNLKNIIFDFGGVIIDIDFQLTINKFKKLGILDFDQKFSQFLQDPVFDCYDIGKISSEEFVKRLKKLVPEKISENDILEAWNAMILDIPKERIKLLENLRKNYRIFLLSNTNDIHYQLYIKNFYNKFGYKTFNDLFEKAYLSFEIGMRKPDAEIFNFVLKDSNLLPEETLFIDDSNQHIESAKKFGIHSYLLENETINDILK